MLGTREVGRVLATALLVAGFGACGGSKSSAPTTGDTEIAFTLFEDDADEDPDVYAMNVDGTGQVRLADEGANVTPAWAPDGTKIAFASDRDGTNEIYVMNRDGSGQTRVTNNPAANDTNPTWSPDGTRIAFASNPGGSPQIYVIDVDGTDQTRLTDVGANTNPAWSPDGTKIAFVSTRGRPEGGRYLLHGQEEIYLMNPDGTEQTRLTHGPESFFPAWSPDGEKIAFTSGRDGNLEIYVINADGTGLRRLTHRAMDDANPVWSHDGTRIAFVRGEPPQIYLMNADGTQVRRLTNDARSRLFLAWRPRLTGRSGD